MSTVRPPTPSRLAAHVVEAILEAFTGYRSAFFAVTQRAKDSFATRNWAQLRADSRLRLGMYRAAVDSAEMRIRVLLGDRLQDRLVWVSAKAVYSASIANRQDWDVAETFFNGVTRRIFDTVGVDPLIEFVASDFDAPPVEPSQVVYRRIPGRDPEALVAQCLVECDLGVTWADPERDERLVAERVEAKVAALDRGALVAVEVIPEPFHRGTGAYVIARAVLPAGAVFPIVLCLRHGPDGVYVDAVLLEEKDVSILFSFTRGYFHVAIERPYDVMRFLRSLIPRKRIAEIYIGLGEPKQGKTELYRALMDHIEETDDKFEFAPGTPGLVMVVFTMKGLDVVIKVIRDEFPPQKATTPQKVRERYRWVYETDRAGRLIDAQEFEHLAFPRSSFTDELLEELLGECGDTVRVEGDRVVVELAYTSRQVTPLNLYVRREPQEEAEAALAEWGEAIRDLAREDIFPGDLLLKNFGVTRHGRVALYDYDELAPLTDMSFRDLPESADPLDDLRAEPWFAVGTHDVFPEEFPRFLGLPRRLRPSVMETCADLFTAKWWRDTQAQVAAGDVEEALPYPESVRLPR